MKNNVETVIHSTQFPKIIEIALFLLNNLMFFMTAYYELKFTYFFFRV